MGKCSHPRLPLQEWVLTRMWHLLQTDSVFRSHQGAAIGHTPEYAMEGGSIALVREKDIIRVDIKNKKIDVLISQDEMSRRRLVGILRAQN